MAEPSPNALIDSDLKRLWELGAEMTGTSQLDELDVWANKLHKMYISKSQNILFLLKRIR